MQVANDSSLNWNCYISKSSLFQLLVMWVSVGIQIIIIIKSFKNCPSLIPAGLCRNQQGKTEGESSVEMEGKTITLKELLGW